MPRIQAYVYMCSIEASKAAEDWTYTLLPGFMAS